MDFLSLSKTALFKGTSAQEVERMLECLGARKSHFEKEEMIYHIGDTAMAVGIVLDGSVLIENDDIWGNRSVLDRVEPGQVFAETYACLPGEKLMVNVIAAEPTDVLFINVGKMLQVCSNSCSHHNKLVRNLLSISAQKNLNLSRRILHTSSKLIRGRLLSYLSYQAMKNESQEFTIPFNRQQLADYLSVDRSAMSNELGKMQRERLIRVDKNRFYLGDRQSSDLS